MTPVKSLGTVVGMDFEKLVFDRKHRVVLDDAPGSGSSVVTAHQLDAVLMTAGFKLSAELVAAFSELDPGYAMDKAIKVINWARELVGDHVAHNVYFIDFPANVPVDTKAFWAQCLADAVRVGAEVEGGFVPSRTLSGSSDFVINLLSLPSYGSYQHSYEEMLSHHADLVPALSDRLTVIHLGAGMAAEKAALFVELSGSTVPLAGHDLEALRALAADDPPHAEATRLTPVRENKAVLNAARVRAGFPPVADTPTDILRMAAELSGGDVTLAKVTKFRSLPRRQRRLVMTTLQVLVNDGKLSDVTQYAEAWKRLGERIHPHEFAADFPAAVRVFGVARGDIQAPPGILSRAELAFRQGNHQAAANWLSAQPGRLWRSADRLLRNADPDEVARIISQLERTAPDVSGRVMLGVREHLQNRAVKPGTARIFVNRAGKPWVTGDRRPAIEVGVLEDVLNMIDLQVAERLPEVGHLVVDPAVKGAAVPLSGKALPEGLGVFPRGSVTRVEGSQLVFFTYWHEDKWSTDFDLSTLFTDREFQNSHHVSWTGLSSFEARHSGDITSAAHGATEFIDVTLRDSADVILPQVYVYSGEDFTEVRENFFGWMTRERGQAGQPFEPRTVRTKSALFQPGKVAYPMAFYRGEDGNWYAKWLHLYLKGSSRYGIGAGFGYRVEDNKLTTSLVARTVLERDYLRIQYLAEAWSHKGTKVESWAPGWTAPDHPVTYIGAEEPEGLPEGSTVYTLANLGGVVPA